MPQQPGLASSRSSNAANPPLRRDISPHMHSSSSAPIPQVATTAGRRGSLPHSSSSKRRTNEQPAPQPSSARPPTAGGGHDTPESHALTIQSILKLGDHLNAKAAAAIGLTPDRIKHRPVSLVKLGKETEGCWTRIGSMAEAVGDQERAARAYENALRHDPCSFPALVGLAGIYKSREIYVEAAELSTRALAVNDAVGDVWVVLGTCYLAMEDLHKAYTCYQQALARDTRDEAELWYGIAMLYDRYGSFDHAEEAFNNSLLATADHSRYARAPEIYFRLGIIYKSQKSSDLALQCFRYILKNPPDPLDSNDIWFQIGHVFEQQCDWIAAREAYEKVLSHNDKHAKVLQQLGGLLLREGTPFHDPDAGISQLTKSLEYDSADAFSWYLLGRGYMSSQNFGKAYEAYQQAVYRDGKNPAFWCSIGVLYYQISQFHDALDAYTRAIRINPFVSEVWHNLGTLYESCHDQIADAIDAYQRTLQLDAEDTVVARRLADIRAAQSQGTEAAGVPPTPKDISPTSQSWSLAAASSSSNPSNSLRPVIPSLLSRDSQSQQGPPPSAQPVASAKRIASDMHRPSSRGDPAAFRPPPLAGEYEGRRISGHQLQPMEMDRPPSTTNGNRRTSHALPHMRTEQSANRSPPTRISEGAFRTSPGPPSARPSLHHASSAIPPPSRSAHPIDLQNTEMEWQAQHPSSHHHMRDGHRSVSNSKQDRRDAGPVPRMQSPPAPREAHHHGEYYHHHHSHASAEHRQDHRPATAPRPGSSHGSSRHPERYAYGHSGLAHGGGYSQEQQRYEQARLAERDAQKRRQAAHMESRPHTSHHAPSSHSSHPQHNGMHHSETTNGDVPKQLYNQQQRQAPSLQPKKMDPSKDMRLKARPPSSMPLKKPIMPPGGRMPQSVDLASSHSAQQAARYNEQDEATADALMGLASAAQMLENDGHGHGSVNSSSKRPVPEGALESEAKKAKGEVGGSVH